MSGRVGGAAYDALRKTLGAMKLKDRGISYGTAGKEATVRPEASFGGSLLTPVMPRWSPRALIYGEGERGPMGGGVQVLAVLGALEERARASVHGWVLDADVLPMRQSVRALADRGLVEIASREDRAELSAWEGTAVLWAARVAPAGHDLLLYARLRPCPEAAPEEPGPEHRLVELRPSQMAALRLFVGLAGQLRVPLAEGLVERVRMARCDHGARRWQLHLTAAQMESVAYGFWLHRMTGSATEANHFTRDYGITHRPAPASLAAAPVGRSPAGRISRDRSPTLVKPSHPPPPE
ncbi:DUF6417 family protein [Streptomyces sp. NBC_00487]|uniref:DUF6417 family protein n=1 Tax=unclassified Streptomyces TaxID=2593676 RepID=UPI002E198CB7|nr:MULTISPECIES: DUF6417 family protein [unclassified Streptomyces]